MIDLIAAGSPGGGPPGAVVYIVAAFGAGGLLTVLWQMYLRWRRGGTEDQDLISRISSQVAAGSAKLLEEYRIELEVAQRQVKLYMGEITELNRLLGQANGRIDRLEMQLSQRQGERQEVDRQLKEAVRRREQVIREIRALRHRVEELEDRLHIPEAERHKLPLFEGLEAESPPESPRARPD